jgi:hypothetical protein
VTEQEQLKNKVAIVWTAMKKKKKKEIVRAPPH